MYSSPLCQKESFESAVLWKPFSCMQEACRPTNGSAWHMCPPTQCLRAAQWSHSNMHCGKGLLAPFHLLADEHTEVGVG